MTRDFNNQRREDPQSDSRGSSSRRFEEERPSRPARPRLNRDMVDRAWENGARQNHADYRTRSDSNSHPPRDNRRPDQHTNRYSAQTSSNGRKPYGNRQDNYRPGERSPRSNNGPRPRTFESSMRTFDDQKYNQYIHAHNIKGEINTEGPNVANLIATHHRLAISTVIKDKLEAMTATRDSLAVMIAISGHLVTHQDPIRAIHAGRVVRKGDRTIIQIGRMNIRVMGQNRSYSKAITSILTKATLLNLTHIKPKLIQLLRSDQRNAMPHAYPMAGF